METLITGREKESSFRALILLLMKSSKFNVSKVYGKVKGLGLNLQKSLFCKNISNIPMLKNFFILIIVLTVSCGRAQTGVINTSTVRITTGAERMDAYIGMLKGKRIGVVANQSSLVGQVHLVDTLLESGINLVKVFSPEHGFRGDAEAGALINNDTDERTGLPVVSLYGARKKPVPADIEDLDMILFDLQDVGARFYTYISTLTYVMEACAEQGKQLLVLDRPNPNGYYIDGPVLEKEFTSFVGMHPVPVVHGMTMAEYARMVNGEKWLAGAVMCDLQWVTCDGYTHSSRYTLPVRPSPNLPDSVAVALYPSLCFFEGTVVSVGRGTNKPFKVIGHPDFLAGDYSFTPKSIKGVSENPPQKDKVCYGFDLSSAAPDISDNGGLRLEYLILMYNALNEKTTFFNSFFEKLAGTATLRKQIIEGKKSEEIYASWKPGLDAFREVRARYLLYPDFE